MDTGGCLLRETLDAREHLGVFLVDKGSQITTYYKLIQTDGVPSSRSMLGGSPSWKLFKLCSMHQMYSSSVSPFHAKTGTPAAAIAAAALS